MADAVILLPCTGKASWPHPVTGAVFRAYEYIVDLFALPFDTMQLCFEFHASHISRDFAYATLALPDGTCLAYTEQFQLHQQPPIKSGRRAIAVLAFSYDQFPLFLVRRERLIVRIVLAGKQRYRLLTASGTYLHPEQQQDIYRAGGGTYFFSGTGSVDCTFPGDGTVQFSPRPSTSAWQPLDYLPQRFEKRPPPPPQRQPAFEMSLEKGEALLQTLRALDSERANKISHD